MQTNDIEKPLIFHVYYLDAAINMREFHLEAQKDTKEFVSDASMDTKEFGGS